MTICIPWSVTFLVISIITQMMVDLLPADRSVSAFPVPSTSTFTESPAHSGEIPSSLFKHDHRDLACQGTLIQGNLPLEIANYLTNYAEHLQADGRLSVPLFNALQSGTNQLIEVLTNCERILRTPIPLAYNIAISQTGIPLFYIYINSSLGIHDPPSLPTLSIIRMAYYPSIHDHVVHPLRSPSHFLPNRKSIRL